MALKIGFLGGGKMAQALARGFIAQGDIRNQYLTEAQLLESTTRRPEAVIAASQRIGLTKGEHLIASAAPQDKQSFDAFKAMGAKATSDNTAVVLGSQIIFLSVKPDLAVVVLDEIRKVAKPQQLFISICMGVTISTIQKALPANAKVIRAMPNTPALIGSGASVYALGNKATKDDATVASKLLSAVGLAEQVPEKWIDPVTGLSGSGPAYVFMAIEALADGGVQQGLPRDLALKLAAQTVFGTGKMVLTSDQHPAKLRDDVTSPAGSTAAGLAHLEKCAVRSAFQGAVEAAVKRCYEMAGQTMTEENTKL